MIIHDVEQRSEAWFALRAGKVTSSVAAEMLAKIQKGEAASRRNLRVRLALERICGRSLEEDGYQSQAMKNGVDREADAACAYEAITGELLTKTGFCQHDELLAGCSLDGSFENFRGLVEIKCPEHSAHLEVLRSGQVPGHYRKQILNSLFVTGAEWCDWMSYQPDFPEPLRVKMIRVTRDTKELADYEQELRAFLAEVERDVEVIQTLGNLTGQLEASR